MLIYYIATAVLSALNLILYVTKSDKRPNTNITVICYICFISNLGYLAVAVSENIEMALLANKIVYLGGCFLLPHTLFALLQLCNYEISRKFRVALYTVSVLMYSLILTIGYNKVYYKSATLHHTNGVAFIEKEYAFGHTIFYGLLIAYMVFVMAFVLYIQKKQHRIPFSHMLLISTITYSGIIGFLVGKLLPEGIESIPLIYVICGWILLYIRRRINMYDIEATISNSLSQGQTYGYLTFDMEKNYLGGNELAVEFLPDLMNLKVDFPIESNGVEILEKISDWLNELKNQELEKTYSTDDKYYNFTIKFLYHGKSKCGYLIEIIDNTDREKYVRLLNSYNDELTKSVEEKTEHIRAMHDKILFAMGNMVENRDSNTGGHIFRTSHVVKLLVNAIQQGDEFQFPKSFYRAVVKYAPLHDLGKIAIDDSILRKPAKLTSEEFDIIKTHSERGYKIVKDILGGVEDEDMVNIACNIARYHHEKWDGSGYPCGLAGEDIPFESRIMALADFYDALVSKRAYKAKMSYEEVYDIVKESMGTHFDPRLFKYFEKCEKQLVEYYNTQEA